MNLFKSKINESEQSLITLQGEYEALNLSYSTLQDELKESLQLAITYKEEFERVDSENKALKESLETVSEEVAELSQDSLNIDEQVSMKAVELLSQVGHEQVEVIETETEELDIISAFKGMKGKELQTFYKEHNKEISAALKSKR